jgi:hypothetical protein
VILSGVVNIALVQEYSGTIDFDGLDAVLETGDGKRWRLENAYGLLIGDEVTIAATRLDFATLDVKAVLETADFKP